MDIILENQYLKVCLSPIGAAIRSIDAAVTEEHSIDTAVTNRSHINTAVPGGGRSPQFRRVTISFAEETPWHQNPFYAGATLAPTAGRIKDGLLPIGSRRYTLSKNENGVTHIHGGFHSLSFCRWDIAGQEPGQSVTFRASLPDGEDGYPGNRTFSVTYRLRGNQLSISQHAKSDQPTYINMSNHTYFNLNGLSASGLNQHLKINADQVVINDELHLPKGVTDVTNTQFDFTDFKLIQSQINHFQDAEQIIASRGYNHCFLLPHTTDLSRPAYALMSSDKKIGIDFYTDAPALVFYSGGFLEDSYLLSGYGSETFTSCPGCAVALEPCFPPFYAADGDVIFPDITVTEQEFNREIRLVFTGCEAGAL